ncbi:MAG: FAD-dependent oxidoreductase [bacterium]|nr:FAD-dependent oxidoreductase [bacterium]
MQNFKYVIVGGGVAGTTAAETLRSLDPQASIALVGDEPYIFYSRIALSKENYMLKKLTEDSVWLKKESFYTDKNIAYSKGVTALGLDAVKKEVSLSNGEALQYEKLLLALGGTPRKWTIPGSDKKGIYYLRTLDDARGIMAEFETLKEGLLIGGGFITFELCDIMIKRNMKPTVMLREPYYWQILLDEPSGRLIEDVLKKSGVEILYEEEVTEVLGGERVESVKTNKGRELKTGFISVGIGVVDRLAPFKASGLKGERAIETNEYMETSLPDVWAAGDCAAYFDVILGERVQLGNWANAMMHGRCAAMNMTGKKTVFKTLSAYTTQGLGLSICFVGNVRVTPDKEVIERGSRASGKISRFIIKNNRIVGATQFNMTPELPWVSKFITDQRDISSLREKLADPSVDLRSLATASPA